MNIKKPDKPVILGKIGLCHGIRGWLKMFSFTEKEKNIFDYQPWFVKNNNQWRTIWLEDWKYHNKNIIFKLRNVNDRHAASTLKNCKIIVDTSALSILKQGEFYLQDLIGCEVITIYGYSCGYVFNIMSTGSNDVLIVKLNSFSNIKDLLIPFIDKQVIKKVNLDSQIIEVDWDPNF